MSMKQRISLFENDAKLLERIASGYDKGSSEYVALKHASIALWYVLAEGHEKFKKYIEQFEGDLTSEQRGHLLTMGIDPDRSTD
jgi:hypothetical protein